MGFLVASVSLDLDKVPEKSLDHALDMMSCTIGTIHLLHEENQQLEMVTSRNIPNGLRARNDRLAVGEGIAGQIVAQREPIAFSDMAEDLLAYAEVLDKKSEVSVGNFAQQELET